MKGKALEPHLSQLDRLKCCRIAGFKGVGSRFPESSPPITESPFLMPTMFQNQTRRHPRSEIVTWTWRYFVKISRDKLSRGCQVTLSEFFGKIHRCTSTHITEKSPILGQNLLVFILRPCTNFSTYFWLFFFFAAACSSQYTPRIQNCSQIKCIILCVCMAIPENTKHP